MPKLSIYGLGKLGVNVDTDPVHSDDGQLSKAQNAIRDPLGGDGALRNRPGLGALNGSASGGSIVGGIGVPLGNQVPTAGTYTFWVGLQNDSTYTPQGWATTHSNWQGGTTVLIGPNGTPADSRTQTKIADFNRAQGAGNWHFFPGIAGVVSNNKLYYAADLYTLYPAAGHTAPPIRVYDPVTAIDRELCRLPPNPAVGTATNAKAVVTMLAANDTIYLTSFDSGTTSADYVGRVFELNRETGDLIQLGAAFPTGYIPYALCWHAGRLWAGTSANDVTFAGRVYYYRPGIDTTWTLDFTTAVGTGDITGLASYHGNLYAATCSVVGTAAIIKQRDTLGAWTTVETGTVTTEHNAYFGFGIFLDALYAFYRNTSSLSTAGLVRRFDGTTWSTIDNTVKILNVFNTATAQGNAGNVSTSPALMIHSSIAAAGQLDYLQYCATAVGSGLVLDIAFNSLTNLIGTGATGELIS